MLCLYLMGLNLSNSQIARQLNLSQTQAHEMATQLRQGIVDRQEPICLSGEVEFDEVYVTAGYKGNSKAVKKRANGPTPSSEGSTRAWHPGKRKASDLRYDSARRVGRDANAGQRSAADYSPNYRIGGATGDDGVHR